MNKKMIFIPLMLLTIQPNKILGAADSKKEMTQDKLNRKLGGRGFGRPTPKLGGEYRSNDDDVQGFLDAHVNGPFNGHKRDDALLIIRDVYGTASVKFLTDKELIAQHIKE